MKVSIEAAEKQDPDFLRVKPSNSYLNICFRKSDAAF